MKPSLPSSRMRPTSKAGTPFSSFTVVANLWRRMLTFARSPRRHPASPARIRQTSLTKRLCSRLGTAVQRSGRKILEDAAEKVVAGPERKSRRVTPEDKRRVAYHETGHALVAAHSKHADVVHKISIVPRGRAALGYTLQLPETDRYLMSQAEHIDKIKGMFGGRAAEELVLNEITTGAENDLEHATAVTRQMVCIYGMGKSVGLVHCGQQPNPFLPVPGDGMMQRDCTEETGHAIDEEVGKILDGAYAESKQILQQHRDQLDLVAGELLQHETLDAQTFKNLINQPALAARCGARR